MDDTSPPPPPRSKMGRKRRLPGGHVRRTFTLDGEADAALQTFAAQQKKLHSLNPDEPVPSASSIVRAALRAYLPPQVWPDPES